jgi:hypothetical protein
MRLVLEVEGVPWYSAKIVVDQAVCGPQWLAACVGKLFEMSEQ